MEEFLNGRPIKQRALKRLVEDEILALQVGTQIAKLRQQAGLTQTELAALAGMSASKISVIEKSDKNITFATAVRIANALGHRVFVTFEVDKKLRGSVSKNPSKLRMRRGMV